MVAHAFDCSTPEAEAERFRFFQASLVYIDTSRTARITNRETVSNKTKQNLEHFFFSFFFFLFFGRGRGGMGCGEGFLWLLSDKVSCM